MGKGDNTWGNREEHLLSGAVLRLDLTKLGSLPLDVKTSEGSGTYNPYATGAPLTIYASGVRNAYDLLWHSNGKLYVPTNGSAAGGNTPASVAGTLRPDGTTYNGPSVPSLTDVQQTQKDFLFRVEKGGYYGHPNPRRGEYVQNGGNPTSSIDPAQVDEYPVGTLPDANWRGNSFNFQANKSPNGIIEYKGDAFSGALKGKLLVVRYSQHDDIITLTTGGTNEDILSSNDGISIQGFSGFVDPLDLIEHLPTGNIYVSEYGGDGKITLLKPKTIGIMSSSTLKSEIQANFLNLRSISSDLTDNLAVSSSILARNNTSPLISGSSAKSHNAVYISEKETYGLNNFEKTKVYPNPLHNRFNIEFPSTYKGNFTIQIIDQLGKVYEVRQSKLKPGGTNMEVDISNLFLKAGIYSLRIQSDTRKTEVIKLIINRNF
jgi:hypothetical protein